MAKPTSAQAVAGERRQVTALFYDIVGSTEALQRLDPEDFARLQRRLHREAAAAIRANDGHLDRLVGDGGSAYFGFPVSSEDAAECAVLSALDLVARCRNVGEDAALGMTLQVRVGIATGMVVISEMNDPSLPGLEEVVGITPALAARIQSEAQPDSVVVSDATYRLTRGAFKFESLGVRTLRGFGESLRLWRPIERQAHGDRFSSSRQATTPLIGRADEIDACRRRWGQAQKGDGQLLMIVGEAGIGKSRLVAELSQELSGTNCGIRILQCLPRGNSRPLHPFTDMLRRSIRDEGAGPSALDANEIRAWLEATGAAISDEAVDMIAFLSGGDGEEAAQALGPSKLSTEEAKRRALDAVFEVLAAWSSRQPQLIILEDLHWADSLTLALIAEAPERIAPLPVLAVVTARSRAEAEAPDKPNVLRMALSRLDAGSTPRLLEAVWSGTPPAGLATFIHGKSDGIPLFAEELASLLKERFQNGGSEVKDWERVLRESGVVTLQDLLAARLSDLGEGRRVAQVASVIGREFRLDLLSRMIDGDSGKRPLAESLSSLVQAGILRPQGAGVEATFRFRHVLIQEAAYDSLLKADRREMHRRVTDLVTSGSVSAPPDEIVAWHCDQAGRPLDAARYAIRAAQSCALRSATREADGLLGLAEGYLSGCPASPEADTLTLQLLATRGPVAIAIFGKGSPQARTIYEKGVALCSRLGIEDRERWFPLYWGWWYTSPDRTSKRARSQVLINDLDDANDPEIRLQALHCAWAANFHGGRHAHCMDCIESGLKLYDADRARVSRVTYGGHDANVCALGERAQLLWLMGDPEGADASMRQAVDWAERIEHLGSLCHALDNAILLRCYERDAVAVSDLAQRLRAFADAHDLPEIRAKSRLFAGWALALRGWLSEGLHELEEGLEIHRTIGTDEDMPVYCTLWAELLVLSGRSEAALAMLTQAIEDAERLENVVWLPELYRQRAVTRGADIEHRSARIADLERAAAISESQGAVALLSRARLDLDRIRAFDPT